MSAEQSSGRAEVRVTIHEVSGEIVARRNGDVGIYLRPEKLDGDGELHLTLEYLGEALRLLGFNRVDLGFSG
ncbi:MAG TPA: hypothetical protein VG275_07220 [Solirubrobacteraceae bacterium]|jgi:hypothetical protein|nr:hypothetical protein [Solirubrobacteraceae bacterium]